MITDKNFTYILLIVIPLYWAGGYLYEQGSFVHQLIVLLWYIICLYYLVFSLSRDKTMTGKKIFVFLLLNIFYWLISAKYRQGKFEALSTLASLKFILMAFLSYYPFYILTKKKIMTNVKLTFLYFALFVSLSFLYIYTTTTILEEQGTDATTNNISYYFVLSFPLSFVFFEKRVLLIIAYIATLFFVIFGAKRGAIICLSAVSIIFFHYLNKSLPPKHKKILIVCLIISFLFLFNYIYNEVLNNHFLMAKWQQTVDGNSSGRDVIYSSIWNYTLDSDCFSLFFGHGFMISPEIPGNASKNFAHQDWLELFAGMGIVGVVFYLSLIMSICVYYVRNKHLFTNSEKFAYLSIITIWFIKPFFSMLYYDPATFSLTATLGILHAKINNKKIIINKSI